MSPHIRAIETGLSSDPEMNWRLSALDGITLISNSDAHSPSRLGREANAFDCELDYKEVIETIRKKDRKKTSLHLRILSGRRKVSLRWSSAMWGHLLPASNEGQSVPLSKVS